MTDHTPSGLPQPQTVAGPMTAQQIRWLYDNVQAEVSKLEDGGQYTFGGWLPIAVRLVERHHGIGTPAPAVKTVAVQEAIADERKSWADASAHDKEIASLALDCLAHRLTCRTPLPVAPKAEPTEPAREHITAADCWCKPEVDYVDPDTGATVYVHRRNQ